MEANKPYMHNVVNKDYGGYDYGGYLCAMMLSHYLATVIIYFSYLSPDERAMIK